MRIDKFICLRRATWLTDAITDVNAVADPDADARGHAGANAIGHTAATVAGSPSMIATTLATAAVAAVAAVALAVLAGCSSAAKDCTARLPSSGPPAESFVAALHSLEQAGLVLQAVDASGRVKMTPSDLCRAPPKQTLDALRSKAVQALTARDYSKVVCDDPPIVIAQACIAH